jgi:hypothetical protein
MATVFDRLRPAPCRGQQSLSGQVAADLSEQIIHAFLFAKINLFTVGVNLKFFQFAVFIRTERKFNGLYFATD